MTTDNKDVSSLLEGLEPKTEFADFKALWEDISAARARKVSLKAIYEQLIKNNTLSVSYVTFTRFVKKMGEETGNNTVKVGKPVTATKTLGPAVPNAQLESYSSDSEDKSDKVVTAASRALEEARTAHKAKDYSRLANKK